MKNAWGVATQEEWSSLPLKERTRKKRCLAKEMRRKPTPAEARLFALVNENLPWGYWVMQRIICGYIGDVVSDNLHLILEADGSAHDGREEYDAFRDKVLESNGWKVVRFKNGEVFGDVNALFEKILASCDMESANVYRRRWEKRNAKKKKLEAKQKKHDEIEVYREALEDVLRRGCLECAEIAAQALRYKGKGRS